MASRGPQGGTPAPTLSRRFQVRGANGYTPMMVMNANGGPMLVINGGSKTV